MVLEIRGTNALAKLGGWSPQVADFAMLILPLLVLMLARQRVVPPRIVLVFLAFYAFALLRGLAVDPATAVNGLRLDITFILLLISVSSGGIDRMGYDVVRKILIAGALLAVAVSLARFAFGPNFLISQGPLDIEIADDWNDGRTLGAPAVIIMALAAVMTIARDYALGIPRPRLRVGLLTIGLLVMIAVSGQRTALLGFVIALGLMVINRVRPMILFAVLSVPAVIFVVTTGIVSISPDMAEGVGQELGGRSGTFEFRTYLWKGFFESTYNWSAIDMLFGLPLGQRPSFYVLERVWTASLHSAYIGLIPIIGYLGTFVLLMAIAYYAADAIRRFILYRGSNDRNGPELRVYLLAILLVYGVSYEWRTIFGLMLGCLFIPYGKIGRDTIAAVSGPRDWDGKFPMLSTLTFQRGSN